MLPKFNSSAESHGYSLITLELLDQYDNFMSSINTIADMGCGYGNDVFWWATRRDPVPPHVPRNYNIYAVDRELSKVNPNLENCKNVSMLKEDFSKTSLQKNSIDLIWCHDSFHYAKNPLDTLAHWNSIMSNDAMIYITLPYTVNRYFNNFGGRLPSGCFYHYMPSNIIYMLGCAGFDLSDSRYIKFGDQSYFNVVGYKVSTECNFDMSWYDLAEAGRLSKNATSIVNKLGYLDDYQLCGEWFNGSLYNFDKQ